MTGAKEIFEQMREWEANHPDQSDELARHMNEENPMNQTINTQSNDNNTQRQLRAGGL